MAKSHAEFLKKFIPQDQRTAVKQRSDAIVIGQILRAIREERHLSQAQIAQRMGLKQPAIARLERQDDVKLSTLQEWAMAATGEELVLAVRHQGKLHRLVG
jgi:transcriptional regulator with XRE-family HTH domain